MIGSSFSIKSITDPTDKDYIKSLHVYNATTPVQIKTNSNEISYWISHDNPCFKIFCFSLFIGKENAGFAMTAFLPKSKILVIDYIAIIDQYRNNTVFLSFFSLVQLYFKEIKLDIDYIVVEISNKNSGVDIDKESQMFLKFLCIEDFRKIDIEYESLPLGINDGESQFSTFLYIKSADKLHYIEGKTFIHFVSSIYKDYYLEWFKPFFNEADFTTYSQNAIELLSQLEKQVSKISNVQLSHSCCVDGQMQNNLYSNIDLPLTKQKSKKWLILFFLLMLLIPVPIIWLYNYVLTLIGIPITSVSSILGGVLGAIFAGIITWLISRKRL